MQLKVFRENLRDEQKVWEELVYCLCTPQTKADNALKAVEMLKTTGYLEQGNTEKIAKVLRLCGVRFHNTKAKNIVKAKKIFPLVYRKITSADDVEEIRNYLAENVDGLGLKEASHLLRNVGFEKVAIIDRHIMKYLIANRSSKKKYKSLTRNQYLRLEKIFIKHAEKLGMSPALLDLLIWACATGAVLK